MLSDRAITRLKPRRKLYRVADGAGLCMEVTPAGSRLWRFRYRYNSIPKMLSLGEYPTVSLKRARAECQAQRELLTNGVDPSTQRKRDKLAGSEAAEHTFEKVCGAWLERRIDKHGNSIADITAAKREWLAEFALPHLGPHPINDITTPEVLSVLRRIEASGKHETAGRLRDLLFAVFRDAVIRGLCERNPVADIRGAALKAPTRKHRAAIVEPKEIGKLLRAIDGYVGQPATIAALKLGPMLFVRPGELRRMEWAELDLEEATWRIPAAKMKSRREHLVPLPKQAVAILKELKGITGGSPYVFPSVRSFERPMSENAVNAALRYMGYTGEQICGHGFRAMASTRLNEMAWDADVIEAQLAHVERNKVRGAYNRAQYLEERRKMMSAWADYLDGLRSGADVVSIRKAR